LGRKAGGDKLVRLLAGAWIRGDERRDRKSLKGDDQRKKEGNSPNLLEHSENFHGK